MVSFLNSELIDRFREALSSAGQVVIVTHSNPDGDAVGSVVALKEYLGVAGIKSKIVVPNPYPKNLRFLDEKSEILIHTRLEMVTAKCIADADLLIALDFNQLSRVDKLGQHISDSNAYKVLIDHHPSPERESFDLVFSNIEASSTCELLFWILRELEGGTIERVPFSTAQSLYVGMVTDTNNFANSVSASTFLMSYELLNRGVDKDYIQSMIFSGFSEERMRMMGHALLNKMVILPEFNAGYIVLTREELERFKFSEGDTEGFVNMPLSIEGVRISALFTEKEEHVRVSLRSSDDFSVNRLSRKYFNGAGHERAAGGRLYIAIDEVGDYFEKSLRMELKGD